MDTGDAISSSLVESGANVILFSRSEVKILPLPYLLCLG